MASATETKAPETGVEEVENTVVDAGQTLGVRRFFTIAGRDLFDEIEWETRDAFIPGMTGPSSSRRTWSFRSSGRRRPRTSSRRSTSAAA